MSADFYDMKRDGVTQSLISMWLDCRQRARMYLAGWDSRYPSQALIEGNIGHAVLEHAYTDIMNKKLSAPPSGRLAQSYSMKVQDQWYRENAKPSMEARVMVERSCALIDVMLPLYFDYWRDDFKKKQWVSLEEKFSMGVSVVGSDRRAVTIPLRGKKDGTFRAGKGLWLFETKFKSMVDEGAIADTLSFETQVMLYLMQTWQSAGVAPRGCLYNVVRRTGMKEKKGEALTAFAKRVAKDVESRPDHYFLRIESPTTVKDLATFEKQLQGLLSDMWDWWRGTGSHYRNTYSCVGKYGKCVYLPVCSREEYGGLAKRKVVFKELEDF